MANLLVSELLLMVTSATLFWTALTDFKHYKIRNEVVLALAGLFVIYSLVSGRWVTMQWNFGFAALALAFMLYAYSQDQIGGGDLKLLTVAFLWTGPFCALPFAILLLIFIGVHYVAARFEWVAVQVSARGRRIPLAPSVAAALIGVFALGCLKPIV